MLESANLRQRHDLGWVGIAEAQSNVVDVFKVAHRVHIEVAGTAKDRDLQHNKIEDSQSTGKKVWSFGSGLLWWLAALVVIWIKVKSGWRWSLRASRLEFKVWESALRGEWILERRETSWCWKAENARQTAVVHMKTEEGWTPSCTSRLSDGQWRVWLTSSAGSWPVQPVTDGHWRAGRSSEQCRISFDYPRLKCWNLAGAKVGRLVNRA